jgi:hypothetical protein
MYLEQIPYIRQFKNDMLNKSCSGVSLFKILVTEIKLKIEEISFTFNKNYIILNNLASLEVSSLNKVDYLSLQRVPDNFIRIRNKNKIILYRHWLKVTLHDVFSVACSKKLIYYITLSRANL